MELNQSINKVAVVGAAGKMGRGISAILLCHMVKHSYETDELPQLLLHDLSKDALRGMKPYLRVQCLKVAEKSIQSLREKALETDYLIENQDFIDDFMRRVEDVMQVTTSLQELKDSYLVFEATLETEQIKKDVFSSLANICSKETLFFSNTSSIPIHVLESQSQLQGRIIGFHFYNPPPVQKLLELIPSDNTEEKTIYFSRELAEWLGKTVVQVKDAAGFIGNGQFIREGLEAFKLLEQISDDLEPSERLLALDVITRDWLLRPMGLFQLIDYVGLDVFLMIVEVMESHTKDEDLICLEAKKFLELGIHGGQDHSGLQKDGFFRYEKNVPVAVFDLKSQSYIEIKKIDSKVQEFLGQRPGGDLNWKTLVKDRDKKVKCASYLNELKNNKGKGASLASAYYEMCYQISRTLVEKGIASSDEDVTAVMTLGFHHLYGPSENLQ